MTTYYVSNAGSNSNSGLTEELAWQTLAKVENTTFATAPTILLKRGDMWRERLICYGSRMPSGTIIDAYGTGANPIIQGSVDLSTGWADQGSNIWRHTGLTNDIGSLIFNSEASVGVKRQTMGVSGTATAGGAASITLDSSALAKNLAYNNGSITITGGTGAGQTRIISLYLATRVATVSVPWDVTPSTDSTYVITTLLAQGDFYYDYTGDYVDMYSASDPGTFYTHIEGCEAKTGLTLSSPSYMTIRNITIQYTGWHGLLVWQTTNHLTFEYNTIRWCGGSSMAGGTSYERNGNAIEMGWGNVNNLTFRYNTFDDIYEGVFSVQSMGGSAISSIYIYGNLCKNICDAFEMWMTTAATDSLTDFKMCGNVFYKLGSNTLYRQETPQSSYVFILYESTGYAKATASYICNNIVHTWAYSPDAPIPSTTTMDGWTIDYNCYYSAANPNTWYWNGSYTRTFAQWQAGSGKDAHSFVADPLLVTPGTDFHLQNGSPCIDTGVTLSNTGQVASPVGAAYDIGMYEKPLEGFFKLCPFRKV